MSLGFGHAKDASFWGSFFPWSGPLADGQVSMARMSLTGAVTAQRLWLTRAGIRRERSPLARGLGPWALKVGREARVYHPGPEQLHGSHSEELGVGLTHVS